jgi:hypothetical protein
VIVVAMLTTVTLQAIPRQTTPQQIAFARVFPKAGQLGVFIANSDGSDERALPATTGLSILRSLTAD